MIGISNPELQKVKSGMHSWMLGKCVHLRLFEAGSMCANRLPRVQKMCAQVSLKKFREAQASAESLTGQQYSTQLPVTVNEINQQAINIRKSDAH